jgi:HAD superfamily hydrolase (TIGR01459 family)
MSSTPSPSLPPRIIGGLGDLASSYDVLLCDVWGVVHNGRTAHRAACDALVRFRAGGGHVVLITNAPRPKGPIFEQLDRLGVPREAFDTMVTSGDVTIGFIAERGLAPLHHVGPERDLALFDALKEQTGLAPPLVEIAAADYVVCTGLYLDDIGTPDDYAEAFAAMRARDLDFISANPDIVVHVGDKMLYCAGALAERYERLGGRVLQAGKPHRPIYEKALAEAAGLTGGILDTRRVLAIGDAMHTDVQGGCNAGLDVLFVTSGIHRGDLHPTTDGRMADLEAAALEQFLSGGDARPMAAIPALVW